MDPSELQNNSGAGDGSNAYVIEPGKLRVRDMPERLRPREEMERLGARNVSDDVLLAIILRSGVKGVNVVDLARSLIVRYGSLTGLATVTVEELASIRGLGRVKAQVLEAALEIARRLSEESVPRRFKIKSPADVSVLLRDTARTLEKETFWALMLDAKNSLKAKPVEVSVGLLDSSLVHAREVFREAIRSASAAIVLAHNHPSGDTAPSAEDIRITRQLIDAGRIVDIKVLDHVILGKSVTGSGKDFLSLREAGIINFG
jgi:DNA repair protein RadC